MNTRSELLLRLPTKKSFLKLKFHPHPTLQAVLHLVLHPFPVVLLRQLLYTLSSSEDDELLVQQQHLYLPLVAHEVAELVCLLGHFGAQVGQLLEVFGHEGLAVVEDPV